MALHKHSSKPHVSSKAQFGVSAFQESKHKRDATGKFADKPGVGDDAPKKFRPEGGFSKAENKGGTLTPKAIDSKHEIEITVKGNPKKGTAAARFALYKPGMTVEEYIAAVGDKKQALRDIAWDVKQGWIKTAPSKKLSEVGAAATVGAAGTATAGLGAAAAASAQAATAKAILPSLDTKIDDLNDAFDKAVNFGGTKFTQESYDELNEFGVKLNKFDIETDPDRKQFSFYTGDGYESLNTSLRNGEPLGSYDSKLAGILDKGLAKSALPQDTVLHRIIGGKSFNAQLNGMKPGDTLLQEAYTSTTLHPHGYSNVLDGFDSTDTVTKMQILARKGSQGMYLEPITENADEFEVLLPRGAALTYLGKKGDVHQFAYGSAVAKADLPLISTLPPVTDLSKAAAGTGTALSPVPAVGFTKIGEKLGSNPGGTYKAPDGEKFYIKKSKSQDHAENELAANRLYEKLGVTTLSPQAYKLNGDLSTGAPLVKLEKFDPNNSEHVAIAQKDFATHAFLGNWDAVGLEYDNLGFVGGKLAMLDAGGALKYRAQGGPKGNTWSKEVTELDTLRADTNPQAKKVFGSMTAADVKASAAKVLALKDTDIDEIVAAQVSDPFSRTQLAQILKDRRDNMATRISAMSTNEAAEKAVVANLVEQVAAKSLPPLPKAPVVPTPAATPAALAEVSPPAAGTKSKVPLASGVPVLTSTNPDPVPLGSKLGLTHTLHMEVQGNPKKATAAARFALYKDGMTVQDYIDAVGDKQQALKDIAWDFKQGWVSAAAPGAVAKAATTAASASTTSTADQVYNKLRSMAIKPTPSVAPPPPPTPKPPAELAPAFPAASLVPKPAAALPSPQVGYEPVGTGSTVVDNMSKKGTKTSDSIYTSTVLPGSTNIFGPEIAKSGYAAANAADAGPYLKAAGVQMVNAAGLAQKSPDDTILSSVVFGNKYVGAGAAVVKDGVAEIKHFGTLKSGVGLQLLERLKVEAAKKGALAMTVQTKAAEFYTSNGFKATAVKDVYELDISAQGKANISAAASVGAPIVPAAKPASPLADLVSKVESAGSKAALGSTLPAGYSTSSIGAVTVVNVPGGHKFDLPGGGGVAALDPKSLLAQTVGSQNKTAKFNDADYTKITDDLITTSNNLKAAGKEGNDPEFVAVQKAQKILFQSDMADPADGTMLFGFSTNSLGKLKGAIAASTAKNSDAVIITDHAGLGTGSGKSALDQLITSSQNLGKKEILVKSGMVDFYKGQGFTPSLTANGYLSLKIDPVTYKPPGTLTTPTYGSASSVSEQLLKQIVKPSATPNTAHVNISDFKKYYDGAGYTSEYNDYLKNTLDKPFEGEEKYYAKAYTSSSSINKPLRDGVTLSSNQQSQYEAMSKAIAKTSFKEDHVLYRGMYADESIKNLFGMLEKGDHFVNPAFTSTTIKPDVAGAFGASGGVGMKIYAKKGAKGLPVKDFSTYPGELETILPASAPLRFIGRDATGLYEFEYV